MDDDVLKKIIAFADQAHGEQLRKFSGERYIVHPVKVMETCRQYSDNPAIWAAALLHDVIEDTPVGEADLRAFLNAEIFSSAAATEETVLLVVELTDVFTKKNYPALNRKKRKQREFERLALTSSNAQTIKYADILDNAMEIGHDDRDFGEAYLREAKTMLTFIRMGHADLYAKAVHIVDQHLSSLMNNSAAKK